MNSNYEKKEIGDILSNLDEKIDIAFRNQLIMAVYQSIPRNYNLDFYMSEVEIHSLGYIQKEPGITAKKLGALTYRTKGTISSMISRLEKEGFVEQKISPHNKREHLLFLTPKGEFACSQHTAFDRKSISSFLIEISKYCTPEDIDGFFKVLHYRSEYFEKIIKKDREEYAEEAKKLKASRQSQIEKLKKIN